MQKKLLAVAVLSAFSGVAAAQSANVTLYGLITTAAEFASANGSDQGSVHGATVSSLRSVAAGVPTGALPGITSATGGLGVTGTGAGILGFHTNAAAASVALDPVNLGSRFKTQSAGTAFGLRGSEDLGNGLSAWFQAELSIQMNGHTSTGVAGGGVVAGYRNTAAGLRSTTWGTVGYGLWDTPFNQEGFTRVRANQVGSASTSIASSLLGGLPFANGAYSGQTIENFCGTAGAGAFAITANAPGCINAATNFDRRQSNSIFWWSPNWNGFEGKVTYAGNGNQADAGVTPVVGAAAVNATGSFGAKIKPNMWSMSLSYTNGPLRVGYAYETKRDMLALALNASAAAGLPGGIALGGAHTNAAGLVVAAAAGGRDTRLAFGSSAISAVGANALGNTMMTGSRDAGHRLSAGYAFSNGFSLGTTWESLKWNMSYTTLGTAVLASGQDLTEMKKTAWRLEAGYATGNHALGAAYTRANQLSGTAQLNGTAVAGVTYALDLSGTGSRAWQINYAYQLSKRTHLTAYYTGITNDNNARYGTVFNSIGGGSGSDPRFYGVGMRHAF